MLGASVDEASADITLELAIADSPEFRSNVQFFEDELEKLAQWLEGLCRALKAVSEEVSRLNDQSSNLAGKIFPPSGIDVIDSDLPNHILKTFADAIKCVYSFRAKLAYDLEENLLSPLQQFLKEDIKEIREQKRVSERCLDRYEQAVSRFYGLSKLKEASALREDAFQLYDVRKYTIRTNLSYAVRIINFKAATEHLLWENLIAILYSELDMAQNTFEVYNRLKPRLDELKVNFEEKVELYDQNIQKLEERRRTLEERAITAARPNAALPTVNPSFPARPAVDAQTPTSKEGYLMKKCQGKALAPVWIRRYYFIHGGTFGYRTVARQRGQIVSITPLNVLLCEVRTDDRHDRRYCFEVISSKRSYVLQAETETDYVAWLQVFEAAKQSALRGALVIADLNHQLEHQSMLEQFDDSDDLPDADAVANIASAPKLSLSYPSQAFERKNSECHAHLPQLPSHDHVLDVFSCAMQSKAGRVQGKMYLTQLHVCFYADTLSFRIALVVPFSQIVSIQQRKEGITIDTGDDELVVRTYLRDGVKTFGALNTIWYNVRTSEPKPLQALFDAIHASYNGVDLPDREFAQEDAFVVPGQKRADDEVYPEDLQLPSGEVQCQCTDHYEEEQFNAVIDVSAHRMFELLYGGGETVMAKVQKKRGISNIVASEWQEQQRTLDFVIPVNNPMAKVKESDAHEVQVIQRRVDYICYVVDITTRTPNLPYGDFFATKQRICITFVGRSRCRIQCHAGVQFFKSTIVKGMIQSAAIKGLGEFARDLLGMIQSETSRRGMGTAAGGGADANADAGECDAEVNVEKDTAGRQPHQQKPIASSKTNYRLLAYLLMLSLLCNLWMCNVWLYLPRLTIPSFRRNVTTTEEGTLTDFIGVRRSYAYFQPRNELVYFDLLRSEEQLSIIRLEVLQSVSLLDEYERHLLESEYINWLLDLINRCNNNMAQPVFDCKKLESRAQSVLKKL